MSGAASKTQPRDRRSGVIFLTLFLDLVGFSIMFPLFPAMLDYYLPEGPGEAGLFGKSLSVIHELAGRVEGAEPRLLTAVLFGGLIGTIYSLLQFITAPLWGALSDRHGRRPILLLTVGGIAASYLLWALAAPFWLFIFSRILAGVAAGNLAVATAAMADITTRAARTGGMALVGIAYGLGFTLGPAIGGLAALVDLTAIFPGLGKIGLHPFSFPALLSLALALLNLWWISRSFPETLPTQGDGAKGPRIGLSALFPVFRMRAMPAGIARTNAVYLLFMIAFSGMEFTLAFLAVERLGFSTVQNGLMFVFIGFVLILVQGGFVRRVSGRGLEKKLALAGLVLGLTGFGILALAGSGGWFFVGLGGMAASVALVSPTLGSIVSLQSDANSQGLHLGGFRSAGSLARVIGPLLAAAVFFGFGSRLAYLVGAGMLIIPLVIATWIRQPEGSGGGKAIH